MPAIHIIKVAKGIPPEIHQAWLRLQQSNPVLVSPYFSPEYTRIVGAARQDVEVAVVENGGQVVALFPYERRGWNLAVPVGSFLSDYHGLICQPDFHIDLRELLRACGLVAWDFNHTPVAQVPLVPFHRVQHHSPIMDLSTGYEAYVSERRTAGTEQIKKNGNLMRRLEREVGPLRFVAQSPDTAVLSKLLDWKTAQFRRNRWRDLFSIPWVRQTMDEIHATRTPGFAGMLSALFAGDKLVAAHFGMRSSTVWHYWFPTYDPEFSKYSPGVTLLLKMAESAASLSMNVIDLGCGEHTYKERLMNGFVATAKGTVELPCLTVAARHVITPVSKIPLKARCWLARTPLGSMVRRMRK